MPDANSRLESDVTESISTSPDDPQDPASAKPKFRRIGDLPEGFLFVDNKDRVLKYRTVAPSRIFSAWINLGRHRAVRGREWIAEVMGVSLRDEALLRRLFIDLGLVSVLQKGVWCGVDHKKTTRPPGSIEPGVLPGIKVTDDVYVDNPDSFSSEWCEVCQPVIIQIDVRDRDAVLDRLGSLEGKVVRIAMRGGYVSGVLDLTTDITSCFRRFASVEPPDRPDHPLNVQQAKAFFVLPQTDTYREDAYRDPATGSTNDIVGDREPLFSNVPPAVVVQWKKKSRKAALTERSDVSRKLYPLGDFTVPEAMEVLGMNRTNTYKRLDIGIERGEIVRISRGRYRCVNSGSSSP